ncbi:hypothetical protein EJB05_33431 [Eragrostis curvula]|uniref:Uncharacterized protein n=1 Tax=Eragrostis curvula TaxID=38414 RepID=A0A5J9U188_9POAL|nr:hypothetical protein EJB05_33431 [Eragrostis curvula]
MDFKDKKAAVRMLPHPAGGCCRLTDYKERPLDFDGEHLKFHRGDYCYGKAGKVKTKCLVNKWSLQNPIEFSTFSIMKNIRNQSILTFENYYEESGQPRIILTWVDGSLSAWLKRDGYKKCFRTAVEMTGSCPSSAFQRMIIDTCRAMEHLFEQKVFPTSIAQKDLFLRQGENGNSIKLLISQAEFLADVSQQNLRKAKLWADVQSIFKDICNHSQRKLSTAAAMLIAYIGEGSADSLEDFPDEWTSSKKKCFLFSLTAAKRAYVRSKLQKIKFAWPRLKNQRLPLIIEELLRYERNKIIPTQYDECDGISLVQMVFCAKWGDGYQEYGAFFTKSLAQQLDLSDFHVKVAMEQGLMKARTRMRRELTHAL